MLKDKDSNIRQEAAGTLDKIGWKPANKSELVFYLVAKQKWKKLAAVGKDAVEILIATSKDNNPEVRGKAVECLGKIGDSRALEPILIATNDSDGFVREIAMEALLSINSKLLIDDVNFLCEKCFLRYKKQKKVLNMLSMEIIGYIACPKCHSDSYFFVGIEKVVLLLDRHFEEASVLKKKEGTLLVNWFKREELFDYDQIWIKDAEDFDIEELAMKLMNDRDDKRRKRLPDIPVHLSPDLQLSQAKINLLKDNFKIVKRSQMPGIRK